MNRATTRVWACDELGAAVHVNGGHVEITLGDGWSGRLTPAEAIDLAAGLSNGIADACALAGRWNRKTRTYDEVTA